MWKNHSSGSKGLATVIHNYGEFSELEALANAYLTLSIEFICNNFFLGNSWVIVIYVDLLRIAVKWYADKYSAPSTQLYKKKKCIIILCMMVFSLIYYDISQYMMNVQ